MNENDISDFNLMIIHSVDSQGQTWDDYELVNQTTDLTDWVMNRSHDFIDGEVYSNAGLYKIYNCDDWSNDDCIWEEVARPTYYYGLLAQLV